MATQPQIKGMDNDTNYWAVLSKSGSGGDTGAIRDGHFAKAQVAFNFDSTLGIPPGGSNKDRMFVQTPTGSYRIVANDDGGGDFTIEVKGSVCGANRTVVWSGSATSGEKLVLEIPENGEPRFSSP